MFALGSNVFAQEKSIFEMSNVKASAGEKVTLSLNLKNNPKFGMLGVKIYYDDKKLEYIDSKMHGFNGAILKGAELSENGKITLYAITINDVFDATGDILDIEFKIKSDCTENSEVKIEVSDYGVDENTPLEYEITNGKVIINDDVISVKEGSEIALNKEVKVSNSNKKVIWSSSDESIATVDEDGNVKFKKNGNVTITATDEDENVILEKEYYSDKKIKNSVNVFSLKKIATIVGSIIILVISILFIKKKRKKKYV